MHASKSPQRRTFSIVPISFFIAKHHLSVALRPPESKLSIFKRLARIQYFVMLHTPPESIPTAFDKLNTLLYIAFDYSSLVEISSSDGPGSTTPPAFRLDYLVTAFERMKWVLAAMLEDLGHPPALAKILETDESCTRRMFEDGWVRTRGKSSFTIWEIRMQKQAQLEKEGRWYLDGRDESLFSFFVSESVGSNKRSWSLRCGGRQSRSLSDLAPPTFVIRGSRSKTA